MEPLATVANLLLTGGRGAEDFNCSMHRPLGTLLRFWGLAELACCHWCDEATFLIKPRFSGTSQLAKWSAPPDGRWHVR
jgi:hypothetical protein